MSLQRHYKAGEALGYASEPKRRVEAGVVYGHLKAVEQVMRDGKTEWKCVCTNLRDGEVCGRERTMRGFNLLKSQFRACKECSDEHKREIRRRFTRGF